MRLVGELTDVPVRPCAGWSRPARCWGRLFFLMDRVDGVVPQDVLPYNFGDNWLHDASPEDQRRLQEHSVAVLARLHAIPDAATTFAFLEPPHEVRPCSSATSPAPAPGTTSRSPTSAGRRPSSGPWPWPQANVPETDEAVLAWGDSRIGNMMYRDFEPVAVLDWEMAAIGPRELDVSWIVFAHQVFEAITGMLELPGMPHFLREEDVVAEYERVAGTELGDLRWYHVYNGVQWAIVFMRTGARQIHFGEIEAPEDLESLFHHKPLLDRLQEVGA